MAVHNCAFTPLKVNFRNVFESYVEQSTALTPLYNEAEAADGTPPATRFDDLTSAARNITFDYYPARSPGSPEDVKWSSEGMPIPPGINVRRLMANSARSLRRFFLLQSDAKRFHKLAVSSVGQELLIAAFWALRAEQLDTLTPTLFQHLARCYMDFMMLQPTASDIIPALVTLALAEAICGIKPGAEKSVLVQRRRDAALDAAAHFVIRHFSGGLGVYNKKLDEFGLTEPSLRYATLDVYGLSPLFASLTEVKPRTPHLMQYSVPSGVVKEAPDQKVSHISKSSCGSEHILKKLVIREHFK